MVTNVFVFRPPTEYSARREEESGTLSPSTHPQHLPPREHKNGWREEEKVATYQTRQRLTLVLNIATHTACFQGFASKSPSMQIRTIPMLLRVWPIRILSPLGAKSSYTECSM